MRYLSPSEIADDVMLYRLNTDALIAIGKTDLQDLLELVNADFGHEVRNRYGMWHGDNPYVTSVILTDRIVDDQLPDPYELTSQVLTIIWKRLQ